MRLIALGDNCIDLYRNTGEAFPGGNALNAAVCAARLGISAEYLGALGTDIMAQLICRTLDERGVCRSGSAGRAGQGVRGAGRKWRTGLSRGAGRAPLDGSHCMDAGLPGAAWRSRRGHQQLQRQDAGAHGGRRCPSSAVCL